MMRRVKRSILGVVVVFGFNAGLQAIPVPPPDFLADTGDALFTPVQTKVLSIELLDAVGPPLSSFGFYFAGDPSTRILVFKTTDQAVGGFPPIAEVDFSNGIVKYADGTTSTFTSNPEAIGFWYDVSSQFILYTDPTLNPGLGDVSGTYPHESEANTFAVGFDFPIAGTLSYYAMVGLRAGAPRPPAVPEPLGICLLALGISGVLIPRRSRKAA